MISKITKEEYKQIIEKADMALASLAELGCDSARIVITAELDDGTSAYSQGCGNFFAQVKSVDMWLEDAEVNLVSCKPQFIDEDNEDDTNG